MYEFISPSSKVMAPDLKTQPRTDGLGDDSARAVDNRPSFVESFTKRHLGAYFQVISD